MSVRHQVAAVAWVALVIVVVLAAIMAGCG
jgi:hypothetical protein